MLRQSLLSSPPRTVGLLLVWALGSLTSISTQAQIVQVINGVVQSESGQPNAGILTTDEAVLNALTDFERHAERNDWQKAFRVLENLPPEKRVGMLPAGNGFMVPAKVRFWRLLVDMNAEGRSAFRLFNEPKAKQLYEKLSTEQAANDPQAKMTAELIYDLYFITSYGDDVANLLGDMAFEKGDFADAASRWRSIIDFHTDSNIPLPRLMVKSATAYIATGRVGEAESLLAQLKQRYATDTVKIGGKEVVATDYVAEQLAKRAARGQSSVPAVRLELPTAGTLQPIWQLPFLTKKGRATLNAAVGQNSYYQSGLQTMVPNHAFDSERIYLNWMGIIFAVDIQTGKLLWRTDSFDKLHPHFATMQQGRVNLSQYGIQVIGDRVLTTALPLDRLQYWQPAIPLTSWNAKTGEKQWSVGGEQNGNISYLGQFHPWKGGILVVTHAQQQAAMTLNAINLSSGASDWSMPLGTFQQKNNPYTGGTTVSMPEFAEVGRQLCVMNNSGAVLQVSPTEKKVDGQFVLYEPKQTTDMNNYYYGNQSLPEEKRLHTRGRMLMRDGLLLVKEVGKSEMFCVDMQSQQVLWKRPTVSSAMIVDADDQFVYLMNSELSTYDRTTGKLRWSVNLPVSGGGLSLVSSGDSVFIATRRGIFEIGRIDGRVKRIVRTAETDSNGISMKVIGNLLVTVSNSAVTGYKLTDPSGTASQVSAVK
jgi:outer membrane protein assembly factor BamB